MADYYTQMTVQPVFPEGLITEEELRIMGLFGIDAYWDKPEGTIYLSAEEYSGSGWDNHSLENEAKEEKDLTTLFQEIIKRSEGKVPWISFEFAYTCNRMRADGFGGSATFITADDIEYVSTAGWLQERISEQETGNDSR